MICLELKVLEQIPHSHIKSYGRDFFIKTHLSDASLVNYPVGVMDCCPCPAGGWCWACGCSGCLPWSRALGLSFQDWIMMFSCLTPTLPMAALTDFSVNTYTATAPNTISAQHFPILGVWRNTDKVLYFLLCIIPLQERKQYLIGLK